MLVVVVVVSGVVLVGGVVVSLFSLLLLLPWAVTINCSNNKLSSSGSIHLSPCSSRYLSPNFDQALCRLSLSLSKFYTFHYFNRKNGNRHLCAMSVGGKHTHTIIL